VARIRVCRQNGIVYTAIGVIDLSHVYVFVCKWYGELQVPRIGDTYTCWYGKGVIVTVLLSFYVARIQSQMCRSSVACRCVCTEMS